MLLYLIAFVIIGILPYIIYLIFKKLRYPILGKIFSIIYLAIMFINYFMYDIVTKNHVKKILAEQEIILEDDFHIVNEKYNSPEHFTVAISQKDKQKIIQKIKRSGNFKILKDTTPPNLHNIKFGTKNYHFGEKTTQNFETKEEFVREFFKPSNNENYIPEYKQITISKSQNHLIFTDVYEFIIDP